jgi:hypothetical protein
MKTHIYIYICIYSCYNNPLTTDIRRLIVKNKVTQTCTEIALDHNSVVLFSLDTNRKHQHKIVLQSSSSDDQWLGITFRKAKVFIHFINEIPYFSHNNTRLTLAYKEQRTDFYKCRRLENANTDYVYPEITYTISPSDCLQLVSYNLHHSYYNECFHNPL